MNLNSRSAATTAVIAALLGGLVVAVAVAAFGLGKTTKRVTILEQAPLSASQANASSSKSLTPRQIYERDAPGVAFIRAEIVQRVQSPFDLFPQSERGEATGSGFVIDKNGTIVTNAHVIAGAVKVTVQLADNKVVNAKVLGKDTSSDLALLKINPDGLDLHPLAFGSSKDVHVGDPTIAIGNPFGLDRTLTTGVVSALQREIKAPNNFTIDHVIQTDAAINPGNSGGPLLDALGRVIGVNSQIETGGSGNGNIGIGFAIPIDTVKQEIGDLETKGHVEHAFLGITSQTIDASLAGLNLPVKHGALVQTVNSGSPADKAGIRGGDISADVNGSQVQLGGDIIVSVDSKPVGSADELAALIGAKKPGDTVTVGVLRDGKKKSFKVTLGNRPSKISGG